jgi:hypothetical protein
LLGYFQSAATLHVDIEQKNVAFVLKHDFFQVLGGLEGQYQFNKDWYIPLGYQLSYAKIEGQITSHLTDRLKTTSGVIYTGLGQQKKTWFWSSTTGARRNDSEFFIAEDMTELKFSDQLEENKVPLFYQLNVGGYYKNFTFALSQLYIPNRILMPKLTAIYSW